MIACSVFILSGCEEYETITKSFQTDSFQSITNNTFANVHLTQSSSQTIEITAPANILKNIRLEVEDNTLTIDNRRLFDYSIGKVDIYINIPKLQTFKIEGSGNMEMKNLFDSCSNINLQINGSGNINASLHSNSETSISINGSGNISINGYTNSEKIKISGSGNVNAFNFNSKTSNTSISGSGNCNIYVDSVLNANISGSGNIRYKGTPQINTNISGSGNIWATN